MDEPRADAPPLPSPEHLAELARRGAEIRREAERLVEEAFRAVAEDPALGAGAADVAAFLARRRGAAQGEKSTSLNGEEDLKKV